MEGHLVDGVVEVGPNGRERYYDSRGYGRPRGAGVELAPVEAAHLLYRGDLGSVDGRGFRAFLGDNPDIVGRFLVYKDLRDRGFYLSPVRDGRVDDLEPDRGDVDLVVHPRGDGPWDGTVEHRIRVVGERATVPMASLGDVVLAIVDEESEITYLETAEPDVSGSSPAVVEELGVARATEGAGSAPTPTPATILDDRVICWEPPADLYERGFYGQRLDRDGDALGLSLLEAAHLVDRGVLEIDGGVAAVREHGRAVEGDRFDRRLAVYRDLRRRGVVPKTGFKFGADFRTYEAVEHVDELGHSELLVRVLPADAALSPRDLSLDVRLAHGVRKRMVFALVGDRGDDGGEDITWRSVSRLTP